MSDVPIEFAPVEMADMQWGVEAVETRGGSVDDLDFTVDNVGIFCLAKKKLADGPMNPVWNGANKTYKAYHVWEDNVQVSIKAMEGNKGIISWDKDEPFRLHYYPSQAWYTYGFMAYYPWTNCLVRENKSIKAFFKVDGNDDVLYAMTTGPENTFGIDAVDTLAFSKQYYDEIRTRGLSFEGTYPKLEFRRLMSRLDFYFCLNSAPSENIHVDKVEFNNFPSVMEVPLASVNNTTGVMSNNISATPYVLNQSNLNKIKINSTDLLVDAYPEMSPCFDHFELCEKGETPISGIKVGSDYKYNLTTEIKKVGDCILIPPVAKSHSKANISLVITLCDDNGNKWKNKTAILLTCPETGWMMGKRYDVHITLNAPSVAAAPRRVASAFTASKVEVIPQ